jgi:hypothetical protein
MRSFLSCQTWAKIVLGIRYLNALRRSIVPQIPLLRSLGRNQAIDILNLKTDFLRSWKNLNNSNGLHLLLLGAALALAAFFRFWAAPLSSGVDVPQFWAFARVFQIYGLDFYRYASAKLDIFPVKGWGYVYPPVWLLILRLALLAVPSSSAAAGMVDTGWRVAAKTPIIAADLAIGCLLYWAIPGSKWRKLLFSSLWLFHPAAWYESAVFGQFDAIAAALLLASVIMLERGKDRMGFLLAGLAVMTKQHTLIPVALLIAISARHMDWRRLLSNCAIIAGVVILFSIPFIFNGNHMAYARSVFLPGQTPDYQGPLCYAFSGTSSLLTYLHNVFGWDTVGYLRFDTPLLVLAVLALLIICYRRPVTPARGALAGFLVFFALSYQVNYQYLIVYIPLALLVAARTAYRGERVFTLILAFLPAAWLWLFDISFWFTFLSPASNWVVPVLARLGLGRSGMPDYAYVSLAVALMLLALTCVVLSFWRWRLQPPDQDTADDAHNATD